ncbi:MAG TPA: RagB/SusD family nutrient uptake outer membrane protein [Mariniphaga sp.]|nr:RagB/SusD family nutrient uptake outer membrane protein [Mariniphaga sp.]
MNINRYILFGLIMTLLSTTACNEFLDIESDTVLTNEQIFKDKNMIQSVLSNLYGRTRWWGQHLSDPWAYSQTDEALISDSGPSYESTFSESYWRVYDYAFVRDVNQFLQGVREAVNLTDEEKKSLEGEVRFLRAWYYFVSCRGLGGVPIIEDEIFAYDAGMDVLKLQKARSTEADTYDYIINECKEVAEMLPTGKQINGARANKWTAKMLQARAAITAASLAKYNNLMTTPIRTAGGEVGIPADQAERYYKIALAAAKEVIESNVYVLQDKYPNDKGRNFYEAVCVKDGNTEVIWAFDAFYPGLTVSFSSYNMPMTHFEGGGASSYLTPVLNLVEDYEPIQTTTPGKRVKIETEENGTYKFYDSADGPFKDRDPRLWGTIIYPSASFRGSEVPLQAGQLIRKDGNWEILTGDLGETDEEGRIITSKNGPLEVPSQNVNKTGFYCRKFLDETPLASQVGSAMWNPHFRISEAYMIVCEASFETGDVSTALEHINAVRNRAGIQDLETLTFDNIVHEYRVEFAFEDHRYWDMIRWRLAHKVWNGDNKDELARHRQLFPYQVVAPGDPNDGKWVFIEKFAYKSVNARYFRLRNYYYPFDNNWLGKNPLLEKNPYQ